MKKPSRLKKSSDTPKTKDETSKDEYIKYKRAMVNLLTMFVGILIVWLIIKYIVQGARVVGMSMYPTYKNMDYILVNKIEYKLLDNIERFDVIVCSTDYKDGELLIKRVIGLPGEKIDIDKDGVIRINGEVIEDTYGYFSDGVNKLPWTVTGELGENEYFVCGDNRNDSTDSRFRQVGIVKEENIIGVVVD